MAAQPRPVKRLGTTAYAVLGLLSLRDWTTYELATQMERGIGRMWSAAPSMVYEEPKHLVARGLASVRRERVGQRPRAVYSITPGGRAALREWLAQPGSGPALQFDSLLKVLFADQAGLPALREILEGAAAWTADSVQEARARASGYVAGDYIRGVDFDRRALNVAVTFSFLNDLYYLLQRWSAWALALIDLDEPTRASVAAGVFDAASKGRPAVPLSPGRARPARSRGS